jgi:hypothetical protein
VKGICKNSPSPSKYKPESYGIEEGEEGPAKGIPNIFNKILIENAPNLEKVIPFQVQEASRIPKRPDQNRTTP